MIINYYGIIKRVRALAGQAGLSVVFEQESKPRTDGSTIYVQAPSPEWSDEQMVEWESSLYHEIGHNVEKFRDCFEVAKKESLDMKSLPGSMLNILDDHRQEHGNSGVYQGRDDIVEEGTYITLKNILENVAPEHFGKSGNKRTDLLEAMLAFDVSTREHWMPRLSGMGESFAATLSEKGLEYYETLMEHAEEFDPKNKTAEEEFEIVKNILKMLEDFDEEEELEQARDKGTAGEDGEESSSEEGDSEEGDSEEGDEFEKVRKLIVSHDHSKAMDKRHKVRVEEMKYHRPTNDGNYIPSPIHTVDYSSGKYVGRSCEYTADNIRKLTGGTGLANNLRKLLQVVSQSHYQHGLKSGKIGKNLHRVTMKGTGEHQRRVFKKKIENHVLDTAVTILVDCSGSMSGSKFEHAAKSALLINESLAKIGVPVEILGFTEKPLSGDFAKDIHNWNIIFKAFDNQVTEDKLIDYFSMTEELLWQNADGESIIVAYDRLIQRKNRRKILIVLSDGSPAADNCTGNVYTFTKEVIKYIEDKTPVEIYGLGIMSDSVEHLYSEHSVINDSSELETHLLSVLKKKVLNL